MLTIRLARAGAKKRPFYHIVATDSRNKRDGRYIERLGYFNPIATGSELRLKVDSERITHWTGHGAQVSERVLHLMKEASTQGEEGVVKARPKPKPKQQAPKVKPAPAAEPAKAEAEVPADDKSAAATAAASADDEAAKPATGEVRPEAKAKPEPVEEKPGTAADESDAKAGETAAEATPEEGAEGEGEKK